MEQGRRAGNARLDCGERLCREGGKDAAASPGRWRDWRRDRRHGCRNAALGRGTCGFIASGSGLADRECGCRRDRPWHGLSWLGLVAIQLRCLSSRRRRRNKPPRLSVIADGGRAQPNHRPCHRHGAVPRSDQRAGQPHDPGRHRGGSPRPCREIRRRDRGH